MAPDPEMFTKRFQFTPSFHHNVYDSIDPTNPAQSQAGRVVLVTGGGRGIGRAVAISFAQAKAAKIIISSRTTAELLETKEEIAKINSYVEVLTFKADVSNEENVKGIFEQVEELKIGTIDVLVCNAGPAPPTTKLAESSSSDWWYYFEAYTRGLYFFANYFINQLHGQEGTIIHVSAFVTLMPVPGRSAFSTAKGACNQIIEHIHEEEANVRVFSVHPGVVPTSASSSKFAFLAKDDPALPAGVILFLTTSKADFLRGRWISANWDVDELVERKQEITTQGLLKLGLKATFGPGGHQF